VWSFFCYDDEEKLDLWATWYHGVDPPTQAAHDERLDSLEQRKAHEWREPLTRDLGNGLIEIKIRGSLQWRLLGCYAPLGQRHVFTIHMLSQTESVLSAGRDQDCAATYAVDRVWGEQGAPL
jgi:hypothetical protein